jgi:hypothetical protein
MGWDVEVKVWLEAFSNRVVVILFSGVMLMVISRKSTFLSRLVCSHSSSKRGWFMAFLKDSHFWWLPMGSVMGSGIHQIPLTSSMYLL